MSFSLDNKSVFTDSYSLDDIVRNLVKSDFRQLSQEFNRFYTYEYMCNSETFNKILCRKNEFYSSLNGEKKSIIMS